MDLQRLLGYLRTNPAGEAVDKVRLAARFSLLYFILRANKERILEMSNAEVKLAKSLFKSFNDGIVYGRYNDTLASVAADELFNKIRLRLGMQPW